MNTLPEMMKDFSLSCLCNEDDHEPIDDWTWYASYKLGYREPNYPMPAIPLAVLYTPDYVLIAEPDWWEGELMEFIIVAEFKR